MFNRERFHLVQPVPEGSLYTYVTTDRPEEIEAPDYFAKLRNTMNVRENDIVRVTSDQGEIKFHAEFCFMTTTPHPRHVIVGNWDATTLRQDKPKQTRDPVDLLLEEFGRSPAECFDEEGHPIKARFADVTFTQDQWEMAVSVWLAELESKTGTED